MSSKSEILTGPHKDVAGYFRGLSTAYGRQTGDATYNLALQFLSKLPKSELSAATVVHDNACGVGTASLALLAATNITPRRIEATDSSQAMISQLEAQIAEDGLSLINTAVADSHALPFADDTFDLSVTNIGVTNFSDAPKALQEIKRTLKPGGLAIASIWKRFTVSDIIHKAQQSIKGPEADLMPVPQQEYFQDGYLRDKMVEAGLRDVQQSIEATSIEGEALVGLREFMAGPMTQIARAGWSADEEARWESAIDEAIEQEIIANAGFVVQAWFVTGRK